MIYFIKNPTTGHIKIGISGDPALRLRSLRYKTKANLELLGITEGERKEEKELHSTFSKIRLHGEWFLPEKSFLDYIKKNTSPYNPPRAIKTKTKISKIIRTFSINKELWRRAMRQAGGNSLSLSFIVSRLLEMWIAGEVEVKITVEPIPDEVA